MQDRQEAIKKRIAEAFEPFAMYVVGSMAVQPEVTPDGPFAEEAERMVENRRDSRIPTSWFYISDFIKFVLSAPLWGTALAVAAVRRRFDGN